MDDDLKPQSMNNEDQKPLISINIPKFSIKKKPKITINDGFRHGENIPELPPELRHITEIRYRLPFSVVLLLIFTIILDSFLLIMYLIENKII